MGLSSTQIIYLSSKVSSRILFKLLLFLQIADLGKNYWEEYYQKRPSRAAPELAQSLPVSSPTEAKAMARTASTHLL